MRPCSAHSEASRPASSLAGLHPVRGVDMTAPRVIAHPGPVAPVRHTLAEADAVGLDFTIAAGESVEAWLARGVAAAGCDSAYVEIRDGRLAPFRYVMPAGSPGPSHAAWYSETFAPEGVATVVRAGAIVGRRDGAPFVHCHGLWRSADGHLAMGHMLPAESIAERTIRVVGVGLRGAVFESRYDPETNFTLFASEATLPARNAGSSALALTLRPNQDVCLAVEALCAEAGIGNARIFGIGSLNGARFEDGPAMHSYASELLIRDGRLDATADGPSLRLDVEVVATVGGIFDGVLVRGDNPVCVTFELVVVAADAVPPGL